MTSSPKQRQAWGPLSQVSAITLPGNSQEWERLAHGWDEPPPVCSQVNHGRIERSSFGMPQRLGGRLQKIIPSMWSTLFSIRHTTCESQPTARPTQCSSSWNSWFLSWNALWMGVPGNPHSHPPNQPSTSTAGDCLSSSGSTGAQPPWKSLGSFTKGRPRHQPPSQWSRVGLGPRDFGKLSVGTTHPSTLPSLMDLVPLH